MKKYFNINLNIINISGNKYWKPIGNYSEAYACVQLL